MSSGPPESVATLPPFSPIEGQKWFDQISSQWESQKNPVCIDLFRQNPVFTSLHLKFPIHVHHLSLHHSYSVYVHYIQNAVWSSFRPPWIRNIYSGFNDCRRNYMYVFANNVWTYVWKKKNYKKVAQLYKIFYIFHNQTLWVERISDWFAEWPLELTERNHGTKICQLIFSYLAWTEQ